jgi:7,8-dihydropterin-6-yl-methyl-4-(beta-D-ribofuranosyl)aminobenzene 5'-phosphate synthase
VSAFLDRNDAATVWVPRSFRGVRNAGAVVSVDEARTLYEGIHSTGELAGIEQSLCIDTPGGIVIVAGCSHPPLPQIVAAASRFGRVCGIVGGLHGNRADTLQGLAWICATHCTRHREAIKSRYPERCIEGGAGRVILIEDGAPSPL